MFLLLAVIGGVAWIALVILAVALCVAASRGKTAQELAGSSALPVRQDLPTALQPATPAATTVAVATTTKGQPA